MKKRAPAVLIATSILLTVGLAVSAGCGGSKNTTGTGTNPSLSKTPATTSGSSSSNVTEQTLGVPIYPGTKPEQAYTGVYKKTTGDGFDKVVEYYRKQVPGATYSETVIESGKGASFVVDSSSFHGNISLEENMPSKGHVTITVSRFSTQ